MKKRMREERRARTEWERDSNAIGLGSCWDQLEPAAVAKFDPRAKVGMQHVVTVPRGHFHPNHDFLHSSAVATRGAKLLKLVGSGWIYTLSWDPTHPAVLAIGGPRASQWFCPNSQQASTNLSLSRTTRNSEKH